MTKDKDHRYNSNSPFTAFCCVDRASSGVSGTQTLPAFRFEFGQVGGISSSLLHSESDLITKPSVSTLLQLDKVLLSSSYVN